MKTDALSEGGTKPFRIGPFALILCLIFSTGLPQASAASREKKWHKDLKALRNNLPSLHVNLFFKMTPDQFNRAVSELDESIPFLQDHEITVGITRIVAMAGDAHTRLNWEGTASNFR